MHESTTAHRRVRLGGLEGWPSWGTLLVILLSEGCVPHREAPDVVRVEVRLEEIRIRYGEPVRGVVSLENTGSQPVEVCLSGVPVFNVRLVGLDDETQRYRDNALKLLQVSFVELQPEETEAIADGALFVELTEGPYGSPSVPPAPGRYVLEISVQTCQRGLLTAAPVPLIVVAE